MFVLASIPVAIMTLGPTSVSAQDEAVPPNATVFGVNVLVGALTAATRAALEHRDVSRAFTTGAVGGAVHFTGKYVASRRGTLSGWAGLVVAATGSSIVANAGGGAPALSELYVPVGSLRLRIGLPQFRLRVGVNLFESTMIAHAAGRAGVSTDWGRSLETGTLVVRTVHREIVDGGETVEGVTAGPAIYLGPRAQIGKETWKHETVHVHQNWFMAETWDRPLELAVRRRIPLARRIPPWIEIGLIAPGISALNEQWWGDRAGVRNLMEREAQSLERK